MYISASGTRLWVTVQGTGPPVLLLHGFPDTSELWSKQVRSNGRYAYLCYYEVQSGGMQCPYCIAC